MLYRSEECCMGKFVARGLYEVVPDTQRPHHLPWSRLWCIDLSLRLQSINPSLLLWLHFILLLPLTLMWPARWEVSWKRGMNAATAYHGKVKPCTKLWDIWVGVVGVVVWGIHTEDTRRKIGGHSKTVIITNMLMLHVCVVKTQGCGFSRSYLIMLIELLLQYNFFVSYETTLLTFYCMLSSIETSCCIYFTLLLTWYLCFYWINH